MPNFEQFSCCDMCDENKSSSPAQFNALAAIYKNFALRKKFAGEVVTVKCYEDNTVVKTMVESPGEARVLVVDGAGSLKRALLGGNLALAAYKNGWAGLLINGCVRDVEELAPLDIGILAIASIPMPTDRQNQGQLNVPVQIQGVWVYPGDYFYADLDGIVLTRTSS